MRRVGWIWSRIIRQQKFEICTKKRKKPSVSTHVGGVMRRDPAGLHVDGVSMLLAQWFIFLWVEGLTLEVHVADLQTRKPGWKTSNWPLLPCIEDLNNRTPSDPAARGPYRTNKAGIVPGVTQSLDELIASFHWEVAPMTLSAEQRDVIWATQR